MKTYIVTGMSCAACSARVERAVSTLEGVTLCHVNLLTGQMQVEGDASEAAVCAAVVGAGYGIGQKSEMRDPEKRAGGEERALKRRLLLSLCFLAALLSISMAPMLGMPLPSFLASRPIVIGVLQLILSAVIAVINRRFFLSGTRAMLHLAPNMDTLVALGSASAWGYGLVTLISMLGMDHTAGAHALHRLTFESSAMILTLITVGKWLEARAKGKTTSALKGLLSLTPKTAAVRREGEEVILPIEQVRVGDIFLLRPGSSVPVDGEVIEGEGAVNEAALSGESIPVDKTAGSGVSAGTVNQSGFLVCRATRVGTDTAIARIIALVEQASGSKAPIAAMADRVSAVFVPAVLVLALITLIAWLVGGQTVGYALNRAISVLVISCPCALGLATPVAIMVGSGRGARAGILFKTAEALECAGRIDTVALDKTGTLTEGKPEVTDLYPAEGEDETSLLTLAYALEQGSEHPLAGAVCRESARRGIMPPALQGFAALAGSGVTGVLDGRRVTGGKEALIAEQAEIPDSLRKKADEAAQAGKTLLYFAAEGRLVGIIAVADTIKPDGAEAVARLRKMGLRVVMLTGDDPRTAAAIGETAGVDEVRAGILPEQKAQAIEELRAGGHRVCMVGDGINDAPALTVADLGIAIGTGTDVAVEAADLVLMRRELSSLPDALYLGRKTLKNVRENLFWAFCYNVVGIPLAAGLMVPILGWELSPMFGAAAMSLSSFCVVSNALRLNLVRLSEGGGEVTLRVRGMMCEHCEKRVTQALSALPGVIAVQADHKTGRCTVRHSGADLSDMKRAIRDAGYRV